ncbi:hypothetical protein GGR50DRAFT_517285 [Xylaria sp. CBS 124048]|nr:hypothetical protein GGR50DRAFT_517285 [Xylaria sp. CBS 124048]
MPSSQIQIARRVNVQQLAERFNKLNAGTPSTNEGDAETRPAHKAVLTGEFRVPLRERMQNLRLSQEETASVKPLQLSTPPIPSAKSTQTPPPELACMSVPECPGAPRANKVHDFFRKLGDEDDEDDILLDSKVNNTAKRGSAMFLEPAPRSTCRAVTPDGPSPLRQSWGPGDLTEINAKLQALLEVDAEAAAMPICTEPVESEIETQ